MSIQKYEALLKIAQLGNITKAAAQLGYTQSALSNVVATLESEWKVKLLVREKYGVHLSQEGAQLLPYLHRIVEENQALMAQIAKLQKLEKGGIRLGAFQSVYSHLLPPILKSFTTMYPDIKFAFKQATYAEIEDLIFQGELDCGFVSLPTRNKLETIPIHRDRVLAVFPPFTHTDGRSFPIADLEKETVIIQKEMESEVLDLLKRNHLTLQSKYTADNEYSILPMVANGVGMCILPELMLQDSPYTLTTKPLNPPAFRTIALAYRKANLNPATKKFIQHVTEQSPLT